MASSPSSSLPGNQTRRQLDELDALLKRMLDLPVQEIELEATAVKEIPSNQWDPRDPPKNLDWNGPGVSSAARNTPIYSDSPSCESGPGDSIPPAMDESDEFKAHWAMPRENSFESNSKKDPTPTNSLGDERLPEPEPHGFTTVRSLAFVPLEAMDRLFVESTLTMGWFGRWLRGPTGRMFLGSAGLAGLILALLWALADRIPWPR